MWLLSQVEGSVYQQMRQRGLNLPPEDFYHTGQPSLNQSVVRINIGDEGGGTGSFISENGLILTNHHVTYDGISALSSPGNNYLKEGFTSAGTKDEKPLQRFSLYIPVEQTEVTGRINAGITEEMDLRESEIRKHENRQRLIANRQEKGDLIVEINDFWEGNRQFMTVYRVIRDVRLVHAPPESIGKYGGDIDNWQWPRHTGDFTILRAYTAPDGTSRTYHEENEPFKPKRFLPIRAGKLQPGDFTLLLGFPGTTYRLESSYAFEFYEDIQLPAQIKAFETNLSGLELEAGNSEQKALENASDRASFANALKYFQAVLSGFETYDITEIKQSEDQIFHQWIQADSLRRQKYGRVLPQLAQSYHIAGQMGELLFTSFYTMQFNKLLQLTTLFDDYYEYLAAPDSLDFSDEARRQLYHAFKSRYSDIDREAELLKLEKSLLQFSSLPESERPLFIYSFFDVEDREPEMIHQIQSFLNRQKEHAVLMDTLKTRHFIFGKDSAVTATGAKKDSLYLLSQEIREAFEISRDTYVQHFQYLEPAQKRYVKGRMEMDGQSYRYPDANFTLRVSTGEVRGYKPEDGLYATPFTTFEGMLKKNTGEAPFNLPGDLLHYKSSPSFEASAWLGYANQAGDLTLNFLTTNDITGGNSGSPVLNASGELIGVAFDSNIEGVVGDYYYLPELNRTISVDIRYILFLLQQSEHASRLLDEVEIRK
ncbi:MAG: S46 family peptidase [Balneolaceae bacterium]